MKERGKAVDHYDQEYNTTSGSDFPCKKHPSNLSSVGICAYCLKDRLVELVCSDCGEQRFPSCSCSYYYNDYQRNGGMNDCCSYSDKPNVCRGKTDDVFLLKRSSSSCVEMKRKSGFWRIKKLFSKKREKGSENNSHERRILGNFEEKADVWIVNYMGVSRSRSLSSFRGGFSASEDGKFSGGRSSISAARISGFNGGLGSEPVRKSGYRETETRKGWFDVEKKDNVTFLDHEQKKLDSCFNRGNSRRVFSLKEGSFTTMEDDDSGFIDLNFDFPSSDSNSGFGSTRGSDFVVVQDQYSNGLFSNGDSCGIKRSRKSFKSWRWIFRQNHPNRSSA